MSRKLQLIAGFLLLIFLTGCNVTKHLRNNETLYTGGKVKIKNTGRIPDKKTLKQELENVLPEPNTRVLGMYPKLWVHYNFNDKKEKGIKAWIRRKLGEPPVLIENINTETIEGRMNNILYNNGYFQAEVESQETGKGKKIGLKFIASVKPPYRINNVYYPALQTRLDSQVSSFKKKTLLKEGKPFSLEKLKEERTRIDAGLKELGYFYFNPDFLIFKVDSTVGNRMVDLHLQLKDETPEKGLKSYRIDEIYLNPDYEIADTTDQKNTTVRVDDINFIKKGNGFFRPKSLTRLVFLKEDSLYSRKNHNITLNRMMGLDVFKYVNIRFTESDSSKNKDTLSDGALTARIQASPLLKKVLKVEVQGYTKSTNFAGPAIQISFKNRNAFRGAELFIANINASYETQIKGKYKGYSAYEFQPQVQLYLPRFLHPFNIKANKSLFVPRTKIEFSYRNQNIITRYRQNSLNFMFGYNWKETVAREHEFNPINVSYLSYGVKDEFEPILDSIPSLKNNFQNQFILGSNYTYTYNNLLEKAGKGRNHFYLMGNADVSGHVGYLIARTLNREHDPPYKIQKVPFYTFSRGEIDFRVYHDLSKSERFATRLNIGVGVPYWNSQTLPLAKQFYVGGPSSLRAFKARTIGPGVFRDKNDESSFFTQLGDMKIEGNIEYRFDLISILKGAIFVDAGNTWLTEPIKGDSLSEVDIERNKAVFKANRFLSEIAVGTGVGLRVDVSFLVLRLDLAFPIRKFYNEFDSKEGGGKTEVEVLTGKDRWVFNKINIFDPDWRKYNLVLNIAIGYPF